MMTSLLSHEPNCEDGLILRGVSSNRLIQYAFLREFFHNVIWSEVKPGGDCGHSILFRNLLLPFNSNALTDIYLPSGEAMSDKVKAQIDSLM